jgi:hypothetical protein
MFVRTIYYCHLKCSPNISVRPSSRSVRKSPQAINNPSARETHRAVKSGRVAHSLPSSLTTSRPLASPKDATGCARSSAILALVSARATVAKAISLGSDQSGSFSATLVARLSSTRWVEEPITTRACVARTSLFCRRRKYSLCALIMVRGRRA